MFHTSTSFNTDIGAWNVASVSATGTTNSLCNMAYAFFGATAFNGDIGAWNIARVIDLRYTFAGATVSGNG